MSKLKRVNHRFVFELRYKHGFTYLDRCGSVINSILRGFPRWVVVDANPQTGRLSDPVTGASFGFNSLKLDLSQQTGTNVKDLMDVAEFGALAQAMTETVVERLELEEFTRVGFRLYQLLKMKSPDDARQFVKDLNLVDTSRLLARSSDETDSVSCAMVLRREPCSTRVEVTAVHRESVGGEDIAARSTPRKIHGQSLPKDVKKQNEMRSGMLVQKGREQQLDQHIPRFAVLIDTDHFLETPPYPDDLDIKDFILSQCDWSTKLAGRVEGIR